MNTDTALLKTISLAMDGLLFPSEIDIPFEITVWDKTEGTEISAESIKKLAGNKSDYIEKTKLDSLFSTVTMEQDWHSKEDIENVKRFRAFASVIKENLSEVVVFRMGRINIDVFIAGRSRSGNIVCISTKQLQT
jgi:hypothetical protein